MKHEMRQYRFAKLATKVTDATMSCCTTSAILSSKCSVKNSLAEICTWLA